MAKIFVKNLNTAVDALPAQNMLISLMNAEQPIHTICGGHAVCSCCRIRILSGSKGLSPVNEREKFRLDKEELGQDWRLACQTYLLRDISIHLPSSEELPSHCSKKK